MSGYSPAAAALAAAKPLDDSPAHSPSPSPSPPPFPLSPSPPPAWSAVDNSDRRSSRTANRLGRRYSLNRAGGGGGGRGRGGPGGGGRARGLRGAVQSVRRGVANVYFTGFRLARHGTAVFSRLPILQKIAVVLGGMAFVALVAVMATYHHRIFSALVPLAQRWRAWRGGWVLVWFLGFVTAFPPLMGYSTVCTLAGVVYGFPLGWPIVSTSSVVGSLLSFLACRTVLSGYVQRLVGQDHRFVALGHVLRRDGLWVLTAVRFCPLPYSLSNGFLATIPNITPFSFALSTALASPKLLVHVFIGSRLTKIAEDDGKMSAADKAANYLSMFGFGLVGVLVGWLVFRRTMARAAELQREEEGAAAEEGRVGGGGVGGATDYADDDNNTRDTDALLDPDDADVAALMDDDDISLWAADTFADGDGNEDDDDLNHVAAGGNYTDNDATDSSDATAATTNPTADLGTKGAYHDDVTDIPSKK